MTCRRRYTFKYPDTWDRGGYSKILDRLQRACDREWWFTLPVVGGQAEGSLDFSFTVAGRDKWWVHHRAMQLAVDCFYMVGLNESSVPVPEWEKLAPHTNRGRNRTAPASVG